MLKKDIRIGGAYACKVSGKLTTVRITAERAKGWDAVNTATNRPVRIATAGKLRGEVTPPLVKKRTKEDLVQRVTVEPPIVLAAKQNGTGKGKFIVCGPNLRDQSKGNFHVHAAGCPDLKRNARREPEYRNGWEVEADSVRSIVEDVYSDFIFHNDKDPWEQFVSDLHFFPCCGDLPMEAIAVDQHLDAAIDFAVEALNEYRESIGPEDGQDEFLAKLDQAIETLTNHITY